MSSTVAFIVGGILLCPPILVFLVGISGAGPRCIQNMVTKFQQLQYADERYEYQNLIIIYDFFIVWFGLCLQVAISANIFNTNSLDLSRDLFTAGIVLSWTILNCDAIVILMHLRKTCVNQWRTPWSMQTSIHTLYNQ